MWRQGVLQGQYAQFSHQGALPGQSAQISHQGALPGQSAQISRQGALPGQSAQISHQGALPGQSTQIRTLISRRKAFSSFAPTPALPYVGIKSGLNDDLLRKLRL